MHTNSVLQDGRSKTRWAATCKVAIAPLEMLYIYNWAFVGHIITQCCDDTNKEKIKEKHFFIK